MSSLRSIVLKSSLAMLGALLFAFAASAPAADLGLEPSIRGANVLFAGTFERLGASNLSLLPASDATAIVRVREVIEQPAMFNDLRDASVTVRLADLSGVVEGGQAIFLTIGSMWGENLGVQEILRLPSRSPETEAADLLRVRGEVARVRSLEADEELSVRLESAEVVIFGRVGEVREIERGREDFGEHAASWSFAPLQIEQTLKGREAGGVYFARDTDFFWGASPKLGPGQDGIFLLQPYPGRDLPRGSYVVVDALDVQPRTELERVRGLLR